MAVVITKRAHGPALLSNATATKYTCPVGKRAVVTHLHCYNPAVTVHKLTWGIGADAAGTRLADGLDVTAGGQHDDYGPYTLEAGEVIEAHTTTTTNIMVLTIDVEETTLSLP